MTAYEAQDIAKNVVYVDRTEREIERYQLYVAIQSNSKTRYKPTDILTLPWDNKWLDKTEFEYNEEEEKRTQEQANAMAAMLNQGGINFQKTNIMDDSKKENK